MLLQLRCSNGSTQVGMCVGGGPLLCRAGPDWARLRRFFQNKAEQSYVSFFFFFFFLSFG